MTQDIRFYNFQSQWPKT